MNMGVDEPGKYKFSRSINYRGVRWRRNIAIDTRDGFAFAIDISGVALAGSNDFSVLDQQRHKLQFNREWTRMNTNGGEKPRPTADGRRFTQIRWGSFVQVSKIWPSLGVGWSIAFLNARR